jgi:hypothetical protein
MLNFFSAIVEHTKRVIYLEDDDVAAVADGNLTIHRQGPVFRILIHFMRIGDPKPASFFSSF